MSRLIYIVMLLTILSCVNYNKQKAVEDGPLGTYYKAINAYPNTKIIDELTVKIRTNPDQLNEIKVKLYAESDKLIEYLKKETTTGAIIPFTQQKNDKYTVESVTVVSFRSINYEFEMRPYLTVDVKYKALKQLNKFDYMHIEFIDNDNFCYSTTSPFFTDSNKVSFEICLNNENAILSKLNID